jgi:hypothetical protein
MEDKHLAAQRESLKERYADLPTEDLLAFHAKGTLSEIAYEVLEIEIAKRGETVPARQTISNEEIYSQKRAQKSKLEDQPFLVRMVVFCVLVFCVHLLWVGIIRTLVGGSGIMMVLFVGVPSILLIKKIFPNVFRKENDNKHTTNKEIANKCGEEGHLAFNNKLSRDSNPYSVENSNSPNKEFAEYWDRGFAAAERNSIEIET